MLAVEFKNLIKQIGFPRNWNDLRATYRYNAEEKAFRAFEEDMLSLMRQSSRNFEGCINLIMKHIDIFDKEQYVFRVARLLSSEVDSEKSIFANAAGNQESKLVLDYTKTSKQQALQNAKKALKKIDIVDIEITPKRLDVYSSQEFVGNRNFYDRKKEKSAASLQNIEETIGFENLLGFIRPTDLIQCSRYPNLGNALAVRIIESGIELNENEETIIEDKVLGPEAAKKKAEASNGQGKAFKWDVFYSTVKKYAHYMDIDKILLLANAVFYNKYGDKLDNFTETEAKELKEFTEKIGTLLENKKVSIDSPRFNRTISHSDIKDWVTSLNRHYINGTFYNDDEILALANDIVNGRADVSILSKETFSDVMQFTTEEIGYILENSPKSLQFLLENGYIDEKIATEAISHQEEIDKSELLYLYEKGLISNQNIAEFLTKEVITFEDIRYLKENEINEKPLDSIASSKKLVDLYFDKERIEEFEEYRRLYKLLRIEGKTIEQQRKTADELIEISMDLLEEDKIYDLYHMGLIPVDTAIEFVGQEALIKAFASGELKPADSKRLYDSGVITIQMLREVLKDQSIDDGQKLVLIYSTFPDREDVKTRSKLIEYINDAAENFKNSGKGLRKRKDTGSRTGADITPQNKYVTDPCSRWKLISSIDSEYSQEYLKDGHIIFYLPSEEKYIIEKLYDKNRKTAYGAATYILDEKTFEMHKDEIIKDDKINKSALVDLRKTNSKEVKKLIHTGWGNAMLKYFGVKESKKYSKEQCRVIQSLAEEVENSKRPLDERE